MASEYDLRDFRVDIVEESKKRPVVIDFWAEWCGPCKVLGPTIEKLAKEAKGKWKLVKIDTEAHPQIAAQFQIKSIPSVKMVYQGKLIAEFAGALPEVQIKKWLEQHLPASEEEKSGIVEVHTALQNGERAVAMEMVKDLFIDNPENDEFRLILGLLLMPDYLDEAERVMAPFIKSGKHVFEVEAIKTFKLLASYQNGDINLPEGGHEKVIEAISFGIKAVHTGELGIALDNFIQSLMYDKSYADELARKSCVAIFKALTDYHPITKAKRRAFSMALS
jgi:putative thioredoxin